MYGDGPERRRDAVGERLEHVALARAHPAELGQPDEQARQEHERQRQRRRQQAALEVEQEGCKKKRMRERADGQRCCTYGSGSVTMRDCEGMSVKGQHLELYTVLA